MLKISHRISLKNNVIGKSHKLELIKFPNNSRRFWLRFDGVNSIKTPEVTLTTFVQSLEEAVEDYDSRDLRLN